MTNAQLKEKNPKIFRKYFHTFSIASGNSSAQQFTLTIFLFIKDCL